MGRGSPLCETHDGIKDFTTWAQKHSVKAVCKLLQSLFIYVYPQNAKFYRLQNFLKSSLNHIHIYIYVHTQLSKAQRLTCEKTGHNNRRICTRKTHTEMLTSMNLFAF